MLWSIEVVQPDHNFKHVGGMTHIKGTLMRIAEHVRAGQDPRHGILCVGPMGTVRAFWQKPSPTKVVFLPLS